MSYDGHLTQADGDNLSTTDLPMPLITLTFVVLWVSTTASAFAFIFWHHDRRRVYLHWGFVATSAGYVGNFTLRHAYWQILSSRGLVPGGVAEGAGLVTVLVYTLLFSTILLICKGLSLTRGYLRNYEWTLSESSAVSCSFVLLPAASGLRLRGMSRHALGYLPVPASAPSAPSTSPPHLRPSPQWPS